MTAREDTIERIERCLELTRKKSITVTIPRLTAERAVSMLKEQEAVKPVRGEDDDFYCGRCGKKITRAIKIYDGYSFVKTHPDHLKPECKCNFCKYCGQAVKWK